MPFLAPIFTAISATVAAGGIGAIALKLGASLLLSAASRALAPKANDGRAAAEGRTISAREVVAPREWVYGQSRKGGTIVFLHSDNNPGFGTTGNTQDLHIVIVLAAHQVQAIGSLYFNGEIATDYFGSAVGRYAGRVEVNKAYGTTTQPAFARLIEMLPLYWTAAHKLSGCAAIYVRLVYDAETFPQGIPNITADVYGKSDILDPRSGTRGYTTNAALCLADYMSLSSDKSIGLGAQINAEDGINQVALIEAANVCDEVVAKPGGGTERRYTCNGVIDASQNPKDIMQSMLTAMAGTCGYQSGQWFIYAGAWRDPVLGLTEGDVREGGLSMPTRISRAENFNGVRGTFVSPENDWQADDFPAYASAAYLAEDGGERIWRDITLPFTISASMAQRLAKIELERARRQLSVEFAGKLTAFQATVGDVVTFDYARWGLSAKPFDVMSVRLEITDGGGGPVLVPTLTLRETSALVYDWTASEAQIYAAAPRTNLPSAFDIDAPGSPTVSESKYVTADGAAVKVKLLMAWPASPSTFVDLYQVQTQLTGGAWVDQGRTDLTQMELLDWPAGNFQFRVRALTKLQVPSSWVSVSKEIVGLGDPPAALTGATIQQAGGLAVLKWAQHPDLDVRIGGSILIRHSAAASPGWANSVSMDQVPGSTAQATVPLKPGAYVLRAIDSGGQLGPETVLTATGVQVVLFLTGTTLQEDATFTGTKTGTVLTTGTLQLDTSGNIDAEANFDAIPNVDALGGVLPSGAYVFATAMNFGAVKFVRLRSVIRHSVVAILDNVDTRPGSVDSWLSFDGPDGAEVDVVVEVRTTTDNPAGAPVWSAWGRAENLEVQAWGVQARATLSTSDAGYTPAVDQLRLIAQEAA